MKKFLRLTTFTLMFLTLLSLIAGFNTVFAAICSGKEDCEAKIKEFEAKLGDTRAQKTSLSSQIKLINTKISLSEVKIENTRHDIQITQDQISELNDRIDQLDTTLDYLSAVLIKKIIEGYKHREANLFDLLLSDDSSTLNNQLKYIQLAQENDRKLAVRTQQVKVNYSEQKEIREQKKQELVALEAKVEAEKAEFETQERQKEALLDQTKNDEVKYQQLLNQATSEFLAINRATATGTKIGPVKKGEPIAIVGNSGYPHCSTGAHLHFEVREDGTWVDPGKYINGGGWDKPLRDPIVLTQGFGITEYSWRYAYSGGIHTGYDMISNSSDVIYAPSDGTLFTSSQNCSGATINIKYIEHGGGVISYYLHVR